MVMNCQRLTCSLNRPKRACNDSCRRKLVLTDIPCEDCVKLKGEIAILKAQIDELTIETIETTEEPLAEDKPKRKYNKK